MVSTFHGLEVGKRGLMVGQASIATTGHNIANANTKGYSRQTVNGTASPSLDVWINNGTGQLGTGVSLESITRVRDRFLDQQYRDQASTLGEWSVKQGTLERLEVSINEPSETGLQSAMNQLRGAWHDLSNDPDSASARAVIKERANEFVETAQSMNDSMANVKTDLEAQKLDKIDEANGILKQIAELNNSINRSGTQSNDLLDKRDVLVEELSKIVDVNVKETNGVYEVTLASEGLSFVTGSNNTEIQIDDASKVSGGELSGIIQSIDIVDKYQSKLEDVVNQFVAANEMPAAADGTPGANLFSTDGTIDSLKVNPDIEADIKRITQIPADLDNKYQGVSGNFQAVVSELGAQSQGAIRSIANHEAALLATDSRRQSVTGVSLDEEMANLIKYQHAYSAAARMISTTDQMLDTIINRMAN